MTEFLVWTKEDLGLDVKEMDLEHQELINRMNLLFNAVENKESSEKVEKLINSLAEYTVKHFADEETYMEKINFTGIDTHKLMHAKLLTQFGAHVEYFKKTKELDPKFFNFLKAWLGTHIRGIDKKYSDHAHGKKAD
jgi:hemerythrin